MIFWIIVAAIAVAVVVTAIVSNKSDYTDAEDTVGHSFVALIIGLIMGGIALIIAGAVHNANANGPVTEVGKAEYRIADSSVAEIDNEDGEFEFYYKDHSGIVREFESIYNRIDYIPGGDQKNVTVSVTRTELGTAVFPWGQARDYRIITVK